MRLADVDTIYDEVEKQSNGSTGIERNCNRNFLNLICDAPTIDAVPVVRCRECKYWRRYTRQWENHCAGECERHRMEGGTYENDFCSYGQRKEDEHDKHPSDPL